MRREQTLLPLILAALACGAPAPPLRQSCETRGAWKNGASQDCAVCVAQTTRVRCDCDTSPAAGACLDAQRAYAGSADCTQGVTDCVTGCKQDCACIDACYQAHATCRSLAEQTEACIVRACDERCR